MLNENLRKLRKSKGISQEELAIKLNVVRQTVSKWEQGLSVPDSEMLIRISEELDTPVNVLLGETVSADEENEIKTIAAKLELLNEQFAKRNESRRRFWRIVFIIIGVVTLCVWITKLLSTLHFYTMIGNMQDNVAIIGGSDGPTSVFVSDISFKLSSLVTTVLAAAVSLIGLYKTKKK